MGREQVRVLTCAAASVALILAGTLFVEWYRFSFGDLMANLPANISMKGTLDLRKVQMCVSGMAMCTTMQISMIDGVYSTLATATLWSSLGFAALVAFQAATHVLTSNPSESVAKLGYVYGVLTLATTIATAYAFAPSPDDPGFARLAAAGGWLKSAWGSPTLIAGIIAGFVALYASTIVGDSSDSRDAGPTEYKPRPMLTASNLPVARMTSGPQTPTTTASAQRLQSGPFPTSGDPPPRARRPSSIPLTNEPAARPPIAGRGSTTAPPPIAGRGSNTAPPPMAGRGSTTAPPPMARVTGSTSGPIAPITRGRTASIPTIPEHLRNRLSYVAVTTELTGGGLDARREDGSSRLVLWRDVVGAVVRRMPDVYSATVFVDIVSTAGSTLRIVPWTRLLGDRIPEGDGSDGDRARALVDYVQLKAPGAKLDAATRQFLDTGEVAQIPDVETLRAHDARLA
jgi:hypothetical protein